MEIFEAREKTCTAGDLNTKLRYSLYAHMHARAAYSSVGEPTTARIDDKKTGRLTARGDRLDHTSLANSVTP